MSLTLCNSIDVALMKLLYYLASSRFKGVKLIRKIHTQNIVASL